MDITSVVNRISDDIKYSCDDNHYHIQFFYKS